MATASMIRPILGIGLLGVCAWAVWLNVGDAASSPATEVLPNYDHGPTIIETGRDEPNEARLDVESSEEVSTTLDVLESFWGMPLSELEDKYPPGYLTESLLQKTRALPPWEDVEEGVRERLTLFDEDDFNGLEQNLLGGEKETSFDALIDLLNQSNREILDLDREGLNTIFASYSAKLEPLAVQAATMVSDSLEEKFDKGDYWKRPLKGTSPPQRTDTGGFTWTRRATHKGWCAGINLYASDSPMLEETAKQLRQLRRQRALEMAAFIESLPD